MNKYFQNNISIGRLILFAGLLLVAMDASVWTKSGEVDVRGGKFVEGKFGRGFLAEKEGDKIVFQTQGHLKREEGTIELWVKHVLPKGKRPEWAPLFNLQIEPFDASDFVDFRGLFLQFIDHSKKIIFILGRIGDSKNGLEASGLNWEVGEAHHVAVSWGRKGMRIYIDGRKVAENNYTGSLPHLPEKMAVGGFVWEAIPDPARAVIDDLRISDIQRSDGEIAQTFNANSPVAPDAHTLIKADFEDQTVTRASGPSTEPPRKTEDRKPPKGKAGEQQKPHRSTMPTSRSFYMGFTPGEWDLTPKAVEETYKFLEESSDLVAHHFDEGIPWPEALEKKPYHPEVEKALNKRTSHLRRRQKVYLSITPVRDGLATYWGKDSQMDRPGKWKNKQIDDPEVITAYLNFTRDLIRRFHPDFLNYAIEANLHLAKNKDQWPKFVRLAREVYPRLKSENPKLPIFISLQIDEYWQDEKSHREAIRQILPYTDYIAVSSYPYFYGYFNPSTIPEGYFTKVAALAPEKPFAVAETGFIAKDLNALGKKGPGSERWQDDYINFLFKECDKLNARFLVWFVPRDYDAMIEKFKFFKVPNNVIELFRVWVHAGLLDREGNRRQAFETWIDWLKLPHRP